jgi:hypothetical protein
MTNTINPKRFVGCCGAYCKTCKAYLDNSCKGCKLGFDTGQRDINKAKCKIKLCCFRDSNYETCADCHKLQSCPMIGTFYGHSGYKYKKYKEAIDFIKLKGYPAFFSFSDTWKGAYGKLD